MVEVEHISLISSLNAISLELCGTFEEYFLYVIETTNEVELHSTSGFGTKNKKI